MTKEERELLLIDLSARLPYRVKCINIRWPRDGYVEISNIDTNRQKVQIFEDWCDINDCKPYLRPLSSMTEEERKEYKRIAPGLVIYDGIHIPNVPRIDWLNAHHFDYRGLIEKGLALVAPEGMYNIGNSCDMIDDINYDVETDIVEVVYASGSKMRYDRSTLTMFSADERELGTETDYLINPNIHVVFYPEYHLDNYYIDELKK